MFKKICLILTVFSLLKAVSAQAQYVNLSGNNPDITQYVESNEDNWNKSIMYMFYSNQPCALCSQAMGMIYQIYEDYAYITIRSIIFQIISVILLFVFVKRPTDYLNYAAITVFSAVGANVLNFVHVRRYCKVHLVFHFNWKIHLIPILIIFGANIANIIYVNSDITLLGLMKNNYVVGIYSVSSKVYQIVKTLISARVIVTVPRLAMLFCLPFS